MDDYKQAKEAFVSGMTGSSITHINLVSLAALSSVALYAVLYNQRPDRKFGFLLSWVVLVLPLLLSMTQFATRPGLLNLLLGGLAVALYHWMPRKEPRSPLPWKQHAPKETENRPGHLPPLPALTTYRAHMMLMTILAILAVDFPVFPRILAKCETYGVSLMDLGVGSFVFSQGMVSAIPLLKNPTYLTSPLGPKLVRVVRKAFPVILLGVARVLAVKGTEYPEHVTEYGVHWNFFITLAVVPILQTLLHPVLVYLPISMVGVLVGLGQQLALSQLGLRDYVLNAPRDNIISQNKEGIISVVGYLAIHLLGLSAGTMVLPPSPSFFRRRQQALAEQRSSKEAKTQIEELDFSSPRQLGKTATELCSYAILWWAFLGLTRLLKVGGVWGDEGGASRRMVNLPYILWVAAYNVTFLLAYIVVLDIYFFPGPKPSKARKDPSHSNYFTAPEGNPPTLLEAINRHGLSIFLLANVMTGIINLSMKTMYASSWLSMSVLGAYSLVVCAVAWYWDRLPRLGSHRKRD
ncbi:GPI-anchored wall transfer protein 1 [Coprinopsis cinerea AmutBmut pab1-1]|nr:GPI-anchored wall transfer protein 1 [Coprinopsis cinerea AmutBmut pab1-1]